MVGITSYGAYVPMHRLARSEFNRAWGGMMQMPGERAVANFDEDSVSMAVEASLDCLTGIDPSTVDGLYFATTTSPLLERLGASIMATALDLSPEARTADITGTLRAGTTAVAHAVDAIGSGSCKSVLVAASDLRLGAAAGDFEQALGDGAATLLFGDKDPIATIKGSYSLTDDFSGVWRAEGDRFVRSWEDRLVLDEGYSRVLPKVIGGLLKKYSLDPKGFSKVVYDSPTDVRRHPRVGTSCGFDASQIQDPMFMQIGVTGAAMTLMMLVAALEEAKAGDQILFASYGNGGDAFWIEVTPQIEKMGTRRGIKNNLASKRMLNNYETYLRWRGLLQIEVARRPERGPTSQAALRRDDRIILGLHGVKCKVCGYPQYVGVSGLGGATPVRVCVKCQAKDQFEDYRIVGHKAKIFSFTHDNLADHPDPPATVTVIDFEEGGRALFEMTDRDPEDVHVGMPVELTFRKLFYDAPRGIHNYYWKSRPIRG